MVLEHKKLTLDVGKIHHVINETKDLAKEFNISAGVFGVPGPVVN